MREHGVTRLDVLKVDIEGGEWGALSQALDAGTLSPATVAQLLVEVHFWWPSSSASFTSHAAAMALLRRWEHLFLSLRLAGFHPFYLHTNPLSSAMADVGLVTGGSLPCCFEIGFV